MTFNFIRNKTVSILVLVLIISLLQACEENLITTTIVCDEEPVLPLSVNKFNIRIETDIVSNSTVIVDKRGFLYGDSIIISKSGLSKTAKIGGHICKNLSFSVDVIYTDTVDNSRLKIEGSTNSNLLTGKIMYCLNINNSCSFIQIGQFSGSTSGMNAFANFTSPLFSGILTTSVERDLK